jgi:hypothetical protein
MKTYILLIIIFAWIALFIYLFFTGDDDDN